MTIDDLTIAPEDYLKSLRIMNTKEAFRLAIVQHLAEDISDWLEDSLSYDPMRSIGSKIKTIKSHYTDMLDVGIDKNQALKFIGQTIKSEIGKATAQIYFPIKTPFPYHTMLKTMHEVDKERFEGSHNSVMVAGWATDTNHPTQNISNTAPMI